MPIKNLSENVRMPRLGKIHLGYRDPQRGFPVKTDYFVLPKEHSDYDALVKVFGEKPKALRILIPVEDDELWATQYYKAYDMTHGLICKGDGECALRTVDIKTKELPTKATETVTMMELPCAGRDCPIYKAKKCGEVMNLRFMLPEVPGIGVWQIDTGSINSILNINSCAKLIRKTFGRITLVPLTLSLEPIQANNPESGKKQTVYVLNLRANVTLNQLADLAREQSKTFMLTGADLEAEWESNVQRDIDTLWPGDEGETGEIIESTAEPVQDVMNEPSSESPEPMCTEAQRRKIFAASKEQGLDNQYVKDYMFDNWHVDSTTRLTKKQASELIEAIDTGNMTRPADA